MLPNARLSVIEGAGHLPHEEAPEEFLRVVDSWISSLETN
jgi:pimeloyl-ACP methyl ester carboxylesterase